LGELERVRANWNEFGRVTARSGGLERVRASFGGSE